MPSQPVVDDIPTNVMSLFQIASDAVAKTPFMLECRYRKTFQETIESTSISSSNDSNITDEDDVFHSCDSASLSSLDSMTSNFTDNVRVNKMFCSFSNDYQFNNYELQSHFCFPLEICESVFNSFATILKKPTNVRNIIIIILLLFLKII